MTVAELLADPRFLLHRIDPVAGMATFVPTAPERLSKPSFIDGRTDFSTAPPVEVSFDTLLQTEPIRPPGPNRMIFHVAFCGSTLLARLLEQEGVSFVLKEPNALVDLANWKSSGVDERFGPVLRFALGSLRRPWSAEDLVVVKPSNWVNNLLGELATDPAGLRPLFITMAPRAYAIAVMRGGRDRLAFAARTAAHLAPMLPSGREWLQSAIAATSDPIGRATNLALVALRVQERLFATTFPAAGAVTLDAETISVRPSEAIRRADSILKLDLDLERACADASERAAINAKRPGFAFSADAREQEDQEVERHHGPTIDASLAWAARVLA